MIIASHSTITIGGLYNYLSANAESNRSFRVHADDKFYADHVFPMYNVSATMIRVRHLAAITSNGQIFALLLANAEYKTEVREALQSDELAKLLLIGIKHKKMQGMWLFGPDIAVNEETPVFICVPTDNLLAGYDTDDSLPLTTYAIPNIGKPELDDSCFYLMPGDKL